MHDMNLYEAILMFPVLVILVYWVYHMIRTQAFMSKYTDPTDEFHVLYGIPRKSYRGWQLGIVRLRGGRFTLYDKDRVQVFDSAPDDLEVIYGGPRVYTWDVMPRLGATQKPYIIMMLEYHAVLSHIKGRDRDEHFYQALSRQGLVASGFDSEKMKRSRSWRKKIAYILFLMVFVAQVYLFFIDK